MTKKNNAITIWRIVFTYVIMVYHFDNKYVISQIYGLNFGWYIGVEFFFIVSGYLLYVNFDKLAQRCHSGWDYFVYRYGRIYPYYLGAFILSFIMWGKAGGFSLGDMAKKLSYDFFEIFAMHGIGLDDGWSYINNTSWFISVLFISGFIIFHCLVKWKDNFINFVAPLLIIICYSFLYRNMGKVSAVVQITDFYLNWPLMRGLADMCMGIFAARLTYFIQEKCNRTGILRVAGTMGLLFVILSSMVYGESKRDFLYVIIMTFSVAVAFLPSGHKIFQYRWIHRWSGITMCMYLIHDAFRSYIFPIYLGIPESMGMKLVYMLLYMVVVTVCAFLFEKLVTWIVGAGKKMLQGMAVTLTNENS